MAKVITLNDFIVNRQKDFPYATEDLSSLLSHISIAAKIVNREVNKAGLVDILGETGEKNIQGENVQKLDIYADKQFVSALKSSGKVAGIVSEERDDFLAFDTDHSRKGKYVVLFDPLDGSSNIDVNVSIGTIFSVYRRISKNGLVTKEDFLQPGEKQVAAGYIIYGSSTMLVYTTGNGVNGFTLDPSIGEFCLSHSNIKIPENGNIYSTNEGNIDSYPENIVRYINYCKKEDKETNRPYSSRYIGSLVADFHRNLIKGGIFIYPKTAKSPKGKLRLLYECNPLSFIVEQAGGRAIDGNQRILEIKPSELHQRVPLIIGSKNMVDKIETFIQQETYPNLQGN